MQKIFTSVFLLTQMSLWGCGSYSPPSHVPPVTSQPMVAPNPIVEKCGKEFSSITCLENDECIHGDVSIFMCGNNLEPCVSCSISDVCNINGQCTGPQNNNSYKIVLLSAAIVSGGGGSCSWDPCLNGKYGAPDPRVTVAINNGQAGQSSEKEDTYIPVWNEALVGNLTLADLKKGFRLDIYDIDINIFGGSNDKIDTFNYIPNDIDISMARVVLVGSNSRIELALR